MNPDLLNRIQSDIDSIPALLERVKEAKARLDASPYAGADPCSHCGGSGRVIEGGCVGYDEYEYDVGFCDHCVTCGDYPWDTNRSWFDEEAGRASLDPDLDEDEVEDELHDLRCDQAYDVNLDTPQVIVEYQDTLHECSIALHGISADLFVLTHREQGTPEWVSQQLEKVNEIIAENFQR